MNKSVCLLWALLAQALALSAQVTPPCPRLLNCPTAQVNVCDLTDNDTLFWNVPPYTWSPQFAKSDLYEGPADLHINALGCAGGLPLTVSYTLYLDLNSDLQYETVLSSAAPPPPGMVLANNAFNPGFSGGDTVLFDARPLPQASKFVFALQTQQQGDTLVAALRWATPDAPGSFLLPRLPEGRHRLVWVFRQGNETRVCDETFRVRDCQAPLLLCKGPLTLDLGPSEALSLGSDQLLDFVSDNISDSLDIALSMRLAGTGMGFPLLGGNPVASLPFDCQDLGSQGIELWARDEMGNASSCSVSVTLSDTAYRCVDLPRVCARPFWDSMAVVSGVQMGMFWTAGQPQSYFLPTLPGGCHSLDSFPSPNFALIPRRADAPLNGVSTFDLLLMSRHMLNIEPFDAPWKLIAADANFSNTLSGADIVFLRRLLLGLADNFPNNQSWRFFLAGCNLPPNPFGNLCPSELVLPAQPFWAYPPELRFWALKVGDVNASADLDTLPPQGGTGGLLPLYLPDLRLRRGEALELPLRMGLASSWLGMQAGFCFDTQKIEIQAIVPDALCAEHFGAAQSGPGRWRFSWFAPRGQALAADAPLLRLRVRALQDINLRDAFALESAAGFAPEGYSLEKARRALALGFAVGNKRGAAQPLIP
jgi:hypothetical protein